MDLTKAQAWMDGVFDAAAEKAGKYPGVVKAIGKIKGSASKGSASKATVAATATVAGDFSDPATAQAIVDGIFADLEAKAQGVSLLMLKFVQHLIDLQLASPGS